MSGLVHLEGELSDLCLDAVFGHIDDLEEHVFASVFPLERDVFVYNIEN